MQWKAFLKGINLSEEVREALAELPVSEEQYRRWKHQFEEDREAFFMEMKRQKQYRLKFLYCYCRFATECFVGYQNDGISEKIYWDTFGDIRIWAENCQRDYGEMGLEQVHWLSRHLDRDLVRLGRLQFENIESPYQIETSNPPIQKGETLINVHIPQGEKMGMDAVEQAFMQAFDFWGKEYSYICHSWLLDTKLKEILPPQSNILQFQNLFQIVKIDYECRQAEERVFGKVSGNLVDYPEKTKLQKNLKQALLQGNAFGNGLGIYKK